MNITERRLNLLKMEAEGCERNEVVSTLSQKYGCKKASVWRDYRERANWQPFLVETNPSLLVLKIHNRLEQAYKKASWLLLTSKKENVQLGAISKQLEATRALIKFVGLLNLERNNQIKDTSNVEGLLQQYEFLLKQQTSLDFKIVPKCPDINWDTMTEEEHAIILKAEEIINSHRNDPEVKLH